MYSYMNILTTALLAAAPFADAACGKGISGQRKAKARSAFKEANIIPGVVAQRWNPTFDVRPFYDEMEIDFGTVTSTVETVPAPDIRFSPENGRSAYKTNYTVLLVDPDAPGPEAPLLSFFLHTILYDAHPTCTGIAPKTKTPYMPLTPLSLAKHRYIFLVYRQPEGTFVPQVPLLPQAGRAMFNLTMFVEDNELTGPVGGNYMLQGLNSIAA